MEEIKVYDKNDQQVTMLVQWDLDIYLHIEEERITREHNVHFFNTENDVAYVVSSTYENGEMTFKIPNRLLFSALPITGYIYTTEDDDSYRSVFVFTILVRERPVPSDFAYLEDDSDDYINVEKVLAECIAYAESAAASAEESQYWTLMSKSWAVGDTGLREGEDTDCSKYYYVHSVNAAEVAVEAATEAAESRDKAAESEENAATSESNAKDSENLSKSYAVGDTGVREGEDTDNSKYYYEQVVLLEESLSGALRPMGTVAFADLPALSDAIEGDMYNISDEFVTTDEFKEGAGNTIALGSNVYKTVDGYWDVLAGSPVTGVKGEKEGSYRRGNVNLTLENFGIDDIPDRVYYLETQVMLIDERVTVLEEKTDDDVEEEDIDDIFTNYTPLSAVLYDLDTKVSADNEVSVLSNDASTLAASSSLEDRVEALEAKTNEDVYEIDVVEIFEEYAEEHPSPSSTGDNGDDDDGAKEEPGIVEPDDGDDGSDDDDGDDDGDDDDENVQAEIEPGIVIPDDIDDDNDDEDDGNDDSDDNQDGLTSETIEPNSNNDEE